MKKSFFVVLVFIGGLALILAQSNFRRVAAPYDGKTPPVLLLPEAYSLALTKLGQDTNQFYCVKTTCLDQLGTISTSDGQHHAGGDGWTFEFSNTNGLLKKVFVYFDKATFAHFDLGPQY